MQRVWLSHVIDDNTPLYGGRVENFSIFKTSSMAEGKPANDTRIESTVHMGTHIDMPFHFHKDGQTVEDFDIDFWFFSKPLYLELEPQSYLIEEELRERLETLESDEYDILIVNTGIGRYRGEKKFWEKNFGFAPSLYDVIKKYLPHVRVLGFDSISITSWQEREIGKVAHRTFLNPKDPILLLEDMNLGRLSEETNIDTVTISPMRIAKSDGLPCSVIAQVH